MATLHLCDVTNILIYLIGLTRQNFPNLLDVFAPNYKRYLNHSGPASAVGIATRYGPTVRGSNPHGGEIFRNHPHPPRGPTQTHL
jgi:hypothetical protein